MPEILPRDPSSRNTAGLRMTLQKNMKILTIGGATQDITFQTKEGVLIKNPQDLFRQQLLGFELKAKINIKQADFSFGGGAANTAVNFARLGNSVTTLICVSNDAIGQEIIKNLKEHKVKIDLIQKLDEKKSSLASTSISRSGLSFVINAKHLEQEHILFTYRGTNDNLKIDLDQLIGRTNNRTQKFDLIYLTSLSGCNAKNNLNKIFRYKNKLPKDKTKIVWNPGNEQIGLRLRELKRYLNATDIFIVNKDEGMEICCVNQRSVISDQEKQINKKMINPRDLLKKLSEHCPKIIAITDGDNGAYCYYDKHIYFEPAIKIKEKDTTGVGDAFGSTFSWALEYTNYNIQKSLQMAIKNAGAVLKKVGAQNGLLSRTELLSL